MQPLSVLLITHVLSLQWHVKMSAFTENVNCIEWLNYEPQNSHSILFFDRFYIHFLINIYGLGWFIWHLVMEIAFIDSLSQYFHADESDCAYCLSFVNEISHYKVVNMHHLQLFANNISHAKITLKKPRHFLQPVKWAGSLFPVIPKRNVLLLWRNLSSNPLKCFKWFQGIHGFD